MSTTLTEPLEWQNSTLLQGEATEPVAALRLVDSEVTTAGAILATYAPAEV